MIKISLCMIVKNEEDVLARCLESVHDIVDEIIIVDTGSSDNTKLIASVYTDKIYDFIWIDDFSAARNFSFSKATKEFVMWLDADDIILQSDREQLIDFKAELDSNIDAVMMKYNVSFDEAGNPLLSYFRERILKRENNLLWKGAIHEAIATSGNIVHSNIAITHKKLKAHDKNRNIIIFEKMLASGKNLNAREQFYYARELYYHKRFQEAIDIFITFLDEGNGWIENNISACEDLANCYIELDDTQKELTALLRSLTYDVPRAEICCKLGHYFCKNCKYHNAIFWYNIATTVKLDKNCNGFISPDAYAFTPYLQMCVCYDKLGDFEMAIKYHNKSKSLKPTNTAVLFNEQYFNNKMQSQI